MASLRTKSSSATRFKLSGITLRFTKGRSGAELPISRQSSTQANADFMSPGVIHQRLCNFRFGKIGKTENYARKNDEEEDTSPIEIVAVVEIRGIFQSHACPTSEEFVRPDRSDPPLEKVRWSRQRPFGSDAHCWR
jgi:hypothetical protein